MVTRMRLQSERSPENRLTTTPFRSSSFRRFGLSLLPAAFLSACSAAPDSQSGSASEASATLAQPVTAAPAANSKPDVPSDYVLVPGGYVHPSCVYQVPNGGSVRGDKILDAN